MTRNRTRWLHAAAATIALLAAGGCATQAPTVAHIHVGHAITGAYDTDGQVGYFTLASAHAQAAVAAADAAVAPGRSISQVKASIAEVNAITNERGKYPLNQAVVEALNHIQYAADSSDASANVKNASARFADSARGVIFRSELIRRYAADADASTSEVEVRHFASEVNTLAHAISKGEDTNGDGRISAPEELGVAQIQAELDAMVAREDPPYSTVDRWYLFNLIQLPDGRWQFRRSDSAPGSGY